MSGRYVYMYNNTVDSSDFGKHISIIIIILAIGMILGSLSSVVCEMAKTQAGLLSIAIYSKWNNENISKKGRLYSSCFFFFDAIK